MATTLQIVDTDQTTVLFDFNDVTGANNANAGSVQTQFGVGGAFALNAPEPEQSIFSPTSSPGGRVVFSRDPLVRSSWRTRIRATSYDNLAAGIGELGRLLAQGGILKYVPNGSANTYYIDFEPSPVPVLFSGTELEINQATVLFDTPQGVTISVLRQPYLRGAELDPALNLLTNATLLIDSGGNGTPDGWTHDNGTDSIQATTEAFRNSHTAAADLIHQDYAVGGNGTYTVSGYARRVSGSGTGAIRVASVGGTGSTDSASISSSTFQRFTATVTTTGATTAIRVSLRQGAASGTTVLEFKNVQLEAGSSASTFRCSAQTIANDPTTANGGRYLPVWIDGDAPTPVKFKAQLGASSNLQSMRVASRLSHGTMGNRRLPDLLNRNHFRVASATTKGSITSATDSTAIGGAAMDLSYRQQQVLNQGNSTGPTATWASTTLTGNTVLLFLFVDKNATGANVTITPPGTWTQINSTDPVGSVDGFQTRAYKIEAASARSGAETFTLSLARPWSVVLVEVQGAVVVDVTGQFNSGASQSSPTTNGNITTTQAEDVVLQVVANQGAAVTQTSPTNNYQQIATLNTNTPGAGLYERGLEASGSTSTAQVTLGSNQRNATVAVAVKGSPGLTQAQRVARTEITTNLDALRGTFDVYARIKPAQPDEWVFTLRWTPSTGATQYANAAVTRDWTAATTMTSWVEVPLGRIALPDSGTLQGLAFELYTQRTSTALASSDFRSGALRFDSFLLVPADDSQALVTTASGDTETWLGSDLTLGLTSPTKTAGSVSGSEMVLGSGNGTGTPQTGAWVAGVHRFLFYLHNHSAAQSVTVAIRNISDATDAATQTVSFASGASRIVTLTATLVAGKTYQAQVHSPSTSNFSVHKIGRTFAPTGAANQYIYADSSADPPSVQLLNSDGTLYGEISAEGPAPVVLEPGLNLLNMAMYEPEPVAFDDGENVLTRTATLACTYAPRWYT